MKHLLTFKILLLAIFLTTTASAQPRIGEKMPEFQLQATDGRFYGVDYRKNQVSILFFMGHT